MTMNHRITLLRFCLGLLLASLVVTSFAAKKPAAAKTKASTAAVMAKVVKQSIAKAEKPAKSSKVAIEDLDPGAIRGCKPKPAEFTQTCQTISYSGSPRFQCNK